MDKTCSKRCGWHRICRVSTTLQPRNGYRRAKLFVSPRSRLAPGYEADIVFLRLDSPHFVPLRSPLTQMIFAENGASVHTVMIGGRIVFQGGQLLTLDESVLRRQAQEAANRLDQANAGTYASAATVARLLSARMHRPHAATKARADLRRLIAPLPAPSRTMR
jgi:hypothetical protein